MFSVLIYFIHAVCYQTLLPLPRSKPDLEGQHRPTTANEGLHKPTTAKLPMQAQGLGLEMWQRLEPRHPRSIPKVAAAAYTCNSGHLHDYVSATMWSHTSLIRFVLFYFHTLLLLLFAGPLNLHITLIQRQYYTCTKEVYYHLWRRILFVILSLLFIDWGFIPEIKRIRNIIWSDLWPKLITD